MHESFLGCLQLRDGQFSARNSEYTLLCIQLDYKDDPMIPARNAHVVVETRKLVDRQV
jgi:hypothetical protein